MVGNCYRTSNNVTFRIEYMTFRIILSYTIVHVDDNLHVNLYIIRRKYSFENHITRTPNLRHDKLQNTLLLIACKQYLKYILEINNSIILTQVLVPYQFTWEYKKSHQNLCYFPTPIDLLPILMTIIYSKFTLCH